MDISQTGRDLSSCYSRPCMTVAGIWPGERLRK
jgi:hypothetical protein